MTDQGRVQVVEGSPDGKNNRERRSDDRPRGSGLGGAEQRRQIPFWEWVVAVFGLILALGSIGFMFYEALKGDSSPPDVAVRVDSVIPAESGYLVQIRAVNRGGSTVAGLTVEGELKKGAEVVETSEATIDYVPSHSERKGGLFFKKDPQKFKLELRALGYEEP